MVSLLIILLVSAVCRDICSLISNSPGICVFSLFLFVNLAGVLLIFIDPLKKATFGFIYILYCFMFSILFISTLIFIIFFFLLA